MVASVTTAGSSTPASRAVLSPMYVASWPLSHAQNVAKNLMCAPVRLSTLTLVTIALRPGLESRLEAPLSGDGLLPVPLPIQSRLRFGCLVQDLQFCLLVLQHSQFRADPRLKIENGFLVARGGNCANQALNGCKPGAAIGERLLRQRQSHGVRPARGDDLFPAVGG